MHFTAYVHQRAGESEGLPRPYNLCREKINHPGWMKIWLRMKLTAILLFIAFLQVNARGYSQVVTINGNNIPFENVLKEIRKQTDLNFLYTTDIIAKAKNVSLHVNGEAVEKVLAICFRDQPLNYSIVEKVVIIKEKSTGPDISQPEIISMLLKGRITGEKGEPVAAASIIIKKTNKGTKSDGDGYFSLNVENGDVLVVSNISYETTEYTVTGDAEVEIVLRASEKKMNEIVVTALGIEKQRRSLGYSTTEVNGDKLTQSREVNLGNALTGMVAGVSVAGVATGPSGSSRVVIRGNASLKGNNQPLYVIDGVPFDNTNQGFAGAYGGSDFGDGLSTINPDDIENIQVLKGVAASGLYGYRGGNGAILITTKSGSRGRGIAVEVNDNFTWNNAVDMRDQVQYEYGQGYFGLKPTSAYGASSAAFAGYGAKLDGSSTVSFDGTEHPYSAYKDNFKNFFQTGTTNQVSVALIGSSEKGHFRIGLSNLGSTTVIPNSGMKQQGINFNGTFNITKKFQASLTANYSFEQVKNRASFSDAPGNMIASVLYLASSFDVRWLKPWVDDNGVEILPNVDDQYTNNPYFVANEFQNSTKRNRLTAGLTLKYNFTDWLSLQGQITRDGYILDRQEIVPTGTQFLYGDNGFMTQTTTNYSELNTNFLVDANKQYGDLTVHANFGGNSQDNQSNVGGIYGAGPFVIPFFYSASNIVDKPYDYAVNHYRVNSLYGSVDLGYKNMLYLSATLRNDWYSTLNINSNNVLYPSVSSSFVFSDAWKMPDWISFGKLRASYAMSSNGTSPYQNVLTYQIQGYGINGRPIGDITQDKIPNQNLRPVKISEVELGFNMQFLNNRLGLDVAVYNKETKDDILDVAVSPSSGYYSDVVNVGRLRNKGIEILLSGSPVRTQNFRWNSSFNIAFNDNKVLALTPPDNTPIPVNDDNYPRFGDAVSIQHIVGLPYAQIVGFAYKRNPCGQIIYDADGFPEQSSDLPVPLGSGIYNTTGGFSNDFSYKNFTFSFLFDFKFGAKIYSGTNLVLYSNGEHTNTLAGKRRPGYMWRRCYRRWKGEYNRCTSAGIFLSDHDRRSPDCRRIRVRCQFY